MESCDTKNAVSRRVILSGFTATEIPGIIEITKHGNPKNC